MRSSYHIALGGLIGMVMAVTVVWFCPIPILAGIGAFTLGIFFSRVGSIIVADMVRGHSQ